MFDIGFIELLLVMVIALLVLGPERLPSAARKVGHWVGRARSMFQHVRYELEREAHNQEIMAKFDRQLEEMGLDEETLSGAGNRESSSEKPPSILPPEHDTQGSQTQEKP